MQHLVIPGRLPGLNELIEANRTDPRAGARLKRETQEGIMWAVRNARLRPVEAPVSVLFLWVEESHRRDLDNVYSGHKYVLDALTAMDILKGDGQKWVKGIHDYCTVDKDRPRVEVILIEQD